MTINELAWGLYGCFVILIIFMAWHGYRIESKIDEIGENVSKLSKQDEQRPS